MQYKKRRTKLYEQLGRIGKLILFSGFEINRSADDNYPFSVNRNFYYLTGINQHDSYLVVDLRTRRETLYILDNDPKLARWIGNFLTQEEAKKISQVENIASCNRKNFLNHAFDTKLLFLDLEASKTKATFSYGTYFMQMAKELNPSIAYKDVYDEIIKLRAKKDKDEIKATSKAIECTKLALEEVMKKLPSLKEEQEAQALFEERIYALNHATPAFITICGSGVNSTVLHYHENNSPLKEDSVVLMDLGARIDFYNADITRTYPTSGKFSPMARKIYQIVLDCNKKIIELAKPGIALIELQKFTIDFLAKECLKAKLIKNYDEIHDVYFHGVSHHLGLDVHDPMSRKGILQVGNIISDEPGLYFEKLKIGVRIEDDLLITKTGCECLSKDIIKEIDDIEAFMSQK